MKSPPRSVPRLGGDGPAAGPVQNAREPAGLGKYYDPGVGFWPEWLTRWIAAERPMDADGESV
jgi:hypothetical protein